MIYTANTFHIMSWNSVQRLIPKVGAALRKGGFFVVYGPFNVNGEFTAESNRSFDESLRARKVSHGTFMHESSFIMLGLLF